MTTLSVSIAGDPSQGLPPFTGNLQRVSVLLGANGSGKSKLLAHLAANSVQYFGQDRTPVLIEGGRPVNIDVGVGLNGQTLDVFTNPKQAQERYKAQRRAPLSSRLNRTFYLLNALESSQKIRHSDEVEAWRVSDRTAPVPVRVQPPLSRLADLFNDVFPLLKLEVTEAQQLFVRKGAAFYPVSSMSDGERQAFTLLADLVVLTNESTIFIVDEPELNLHPTLAERLWSSIEQAFPKDIFLYATHSLSFALRSDVEAVFALGHGQLDMSATNHGATDLRPFLGAIPGIIRSQHCLYVEGDDSSFDRSFYNWLLSRREIEITPLGSSTEVAAAASRQGIWQQLSPTLRAAGVIDRDFAATTAETTNNIVVLAFHEAESYLCHPDIILALRDALGNSVSPISRDSVIDKIVANARKRLPYIVAQRVYSRTYVNLRLSVERSGFKAITSVAQARQLILPAAKAESGKAAEVFDEQKMLAVIAEEEAVCTTAIEQRNVSDLLRLFEGKSLLHSLCKMAGCETPQGMINALAKHVSVSAFPHLQTLRASIAAALQLDMPASPTA